MMMTWPPRGSIKGAVEERKKARLRRAERDLSISQRLPLVGAPVPRSDAGDASVCIHSLAAPRDASTCDWQTAGLRPSAVSCCYDTSSRNTYAQCLPIGVRARPSLSLRLAQTILFKRHKREIPATRRITAYSRLQARTQTLRYLGFQSALSFLAAHLLHRRHRSSPSQIPQDSSTAPPSSTRSPMSSAPCKYTTCCFLHKLKRLKAPRTPADTLSNRLGHIAANSNSGETNC